MRKIIIAIDSFKGCLTSKEAGQAAANGVKAIFPSCEVICLPVADGGEGMVEVLVEATKGKMVEVEAHDPLMNLHHTHYGISGDGTTAFIEMASISGLTLVPLEQRNPMLTTTYGTGELIRDALEHGCCNFIIGIGGSATNDAGLGMLQALGYVLKDEDGKELGVANGHIMSQVAFIDTDTVNPLLKQARFTVACDVNNPFYGIQGAAYIYAPQKGADEEMVRTLDKGMRHIAEVYQQATGREISHIPGAGAAGGMGGCLHAFFNTELKPGIKLILEALNFADQIKDADLILTGEGKADQQTVMGKVPYGVLEEALKQQIPVILIAGSVSDVHELNKAGFTGVFSITPSPLSLEQAMLPDFTRSNIQRTVEQIVRITQLRHADASEKGKCTNKDNFQLISF